MNAVKPLVLREYKSLQAHGRSRRLCLRRAALRQQSVPGAARAAAEMLRHNVEWIAEGASKFVASHRGATSCTSAGRCRTTPTSASRSTPTFATRRAACGRRIAGSSAPSATRMAAHRRPSRHASDGPRALSARAGVARRGRRPRARRARAQRARRLHRRPPLVRQRLLHARLAGAAHVRWPEHVPPRTAAVAALASHLDLLPTILDAANVPRRSAPSPAARRYRRCPARRSRRCSSRSGQSPRAPLLRDHSRAPCSPERARLLYAPQIKPLAKGGSTTRGTTTRRTATTRRTGGRSCCYDLGADADEQVNLANDTSRAPLLAEMRALLQGLEARGDACA